MALRIYARAPSAAVVPFRHVRTNPLEHRVYLTALIDSKTNKAYRMIISSDQQPSVDFHGIPNEVFPRLITVTLDSAAGENFTEAKHRLKAKLALL